MARIEYAISCDRCNGICFAISVDRAASVKQALARAIQLERIHEDGGEHICGECKEPSPPRPKRRPPAVRWLYLIQDDMTGLIKIGIAVDPQQREKTLLAERPRLTLLKAWRGKAADERRLHKWFASQRKRGEWFDLSPEDIELIESEMQEREVWCH